MEREILFRGKRMDNGQWVEAASLIRAVDGATADYYMATGRLTDFLVDGDDNVHGISLSSEALFCRIVPDTLGRFTGMRDAAGRRVFEGDIIRADNGKQKTVAVVRYGQYTPKLFYKMLDAHRLGLGHVPAVGFYAESVADGEEMILFQSPCATVIGNIYDNPELMG